MILSGVPGMIRYIRDGGCAKCEVQRSHRVGMVLIRFSKPYNKGT